MENDIKPSKKRAKKKIKAADLKELNKIAEALSEFHEDADKKLEELEKCCIDRNLSVR